MSSPLPIELTPAGVLVTPSLGVLLRKYRTRARFSQNQLADLASVNQAYVNRMENGAKDIHPSRDIVLRIASALGLTCREIDQLLFSAGLAPTVDWQKVAEHYEGQVRGLLEVIPNRELTSGDR